MATVVARGIGFLLPLLALPACFDVQSVAPGDGTFKIDDFEDGDTLPTSLLFERWGCDTFPPIGQAPDQTVDCNLETPGHQSTYGMSVAFKLHSVLPDLQYAGAVLQTVVSYEAVDLTHYETLVFDMKVEFDGTPPPMVQIDIQLGCDSVKPKNDGSPDQRYFDAIHALTVTGTWQQFPLSLANDFSQRSDELNHFADGLQSCLKVVNSIRFEVVAPFTYGQSGSGVFHVDDVHLERGHSK